MNKRIVKTMKVSCPFYWTDKYTKLVATRPYGCILALKRSSHLQDKHRIRLILCLSYVWDESYPISVNSIGFLKILCLLLSYAYPMRILCFSLSKSILPYPMSLSYAYPMFGFSTQDKHRIVGLNHALFGKPKHRISIG